MAKFHKIAKKYLIGERIMRKVVGEKTYDELHPIGTAAVEAEKPPPPPPAPIPMPDEEDIRRTRRRGQGQRGGRTATILSSESSSDRLGP